MRAPDLTRATRASSFDRHFRSFSYTVNFDARQALQVLKIGRMQRPFFSFPVRHEIRYITDCLPAQWAWITAHAIRGPAFPVGWVV